MIKSLLKILRRDVEHEADPSEAPGLVQKPLHQNNHPVCSVYTKTLGADFPLQVREVSPYGISVESGHEIFRAGEYVVVKMIFPKMTVSMPGRVVNVGAARSEALHLYYIEFHRS